MPKPIHSPKIKKSRWFRVRVGVTAQLGVLLAVLWTGATRADLIGHGGMVRAIDVAPDGRTVLTGSFDFTVRLWDFGTQTEKAVLDGHEGPVTSASFFPDGKHAVTTSDDRRAIIWNVQTGKSERRLEGHRHKVMAAAVSSDGALVATGSWDMTVHIWDAATGKSIRVIDLRTPVNDVAFVAGGAGGKEKWLAAGGHDGKITLWRVADGKFEGVLEGHVRGISKMSASSDGRRLVSASIDRTIRLWDVPGMKELKVLQHSDDRAGQVYSTDISPDGRRALSAGKDGRIMVWNLDTGQVLQTIPAHTKIIWAVGFTPDGRFALSGSSDEKAAVWHLETGDRIGLTGDEKDEPQPWLESAHPGAKLFTKCAPCHALNAAANRRSGPHFKGLWGRRVGSVSDYNYSGALKGKEFIWNEKTLFDLFHQGPDKYLPGTKMPVQLVPDDEQLAQLIDYLRVLTGPKGN
ncbi:MAG: c-type cytochrome [Rhodospirillaceae bacterium]